MLEAFNLACDFMRMVGLIMACIGIFTVGVAVLAVMGIIIKAVIKVASSIRKLFS